MNWKEAAWRILIIITVATVGFGTYVGWQNKDEIYEYRTDGGKWETTSENCIPGTFEKDTVYLYERRPDLSYHYLGECRTLKSTSLGLLAGFLPPLALLVVYFLLGWILRGLSVDRPKSVAATEIRDADS